MQREIKFRGWNASSKLIVDNVMSLTKSSHLGSKHYSPSMGMIACDEVMQFTGLFDKNGKEIYEGDIIGWTFNDIPKNEIIFKEGCLGHLILITNGWSEFIPINKERASSMLVEGNIFENPDLLK